ncbi:MAG: FAD-dependent oxidoreductase [Acidimicrobiia bacterium]|nr:FAD-dependent oxidoreductase [Acidimicrobiia bacterium]
MAGAIKLIGPDLVTETIPAEAIGGDVPFVGHLDGKPVVVVRTPDGVRAVGGRCTHYGGPLGDGLCDGERIHCPWHHAVYDVTTGEAVGAPALNPIPVYRATERDGQVTVEGPVEPSIPYRQPPANPESVVIVGSGAAGATAAETLRRLGYTNPITLIGEEAPVDRPNLSKDFLAGTAPEDWLPLRGLKFYADHDIELVTERQVESIDREQQEVVLDDGERFGYEALLLAPGAEPIRPPIDGADRPHVHYLRTLADSRAIVAAADAATDAAIVGAGFIGLEVAASLRQRGLAVTVIAPEEVPLAHIVGDALGRFVRDLHQEHGVELRLGRTVNEIRSDEVVLDDGSTVPAGMVVIGVGVKPRTGLAADAGLDIDKGIVVDDRLRTTDEHIWAAGDAARYPHPTAGPVRIEHWVLAQRQGQTAAANILGHDEAFTVPPFFWSQHYDIPINVTGHTGGWDEEIVRGDPAQHDVIVGYRSGNRIAAVASIYRDLDNLRAEVALAGDDQQALHGLLTEE